MSDLPDTSNWPISATTLHQRCCTLSMPSWWVSAKNPVPQGPLDNDITEIISLRASQWLDEPTPQLVPVAAGWLLPIPIARSRKKDGLLVVLHAQHDQHVASHTSTMLSFIASDLSSLDHDDHALDIFTDQLTESYEYISLLYRLLRTMGGLNDPARFVQNALGELGDTACFGWSAAVFSSTDHPSNIEPGCMIHGCPDNDAFRHALVRLADGLGTLNSGQIVERSPSWSDEVTTGLGRQIIAEPLRVDGQQAGMLLLGAKEAEDPEATSHDTQLVEAVAAFISAMLDTSRLYLEQESLYLGIITAMSSALDAKDHYTRGHSERVATMARSLALAFGFDTDAAHRIYISGLLHDVGKIGVPESVLLKSGPLTPEEFEHIKKHPALGHKILKAIPGLDDLLPAVLHHHERWDGNGYPHGLSGATIPIEARIMALADTFDAMSSNRSYRPAMPRDHVLKEIADCAGTQFDPELAPLFITLDFDEFDRLMEAHKASDLDAQSPHAA